MTRRESEAILRRGVIESSKSKVRMMRRCATRQVDLVRVVSSSC